MKNNKFLPSQKTDIEAVNSLSSLFKSLFFRYTSFYSLLVAMLLFSSCGNDETPVTPTNPTPTNPTPAVQPTTLTLALISGQTAEATVGGSTLDLKTIYAITAEPATADKTVTWSVDNTDIAMVVADTGVLTPVAAGTVKVKVTGKTATGVSSSEVEVTIKATAPTQFTVTFATNGGTPATIASQTVDSGAMATAPAVPTRSGYTFNGWFAPNTTTVFDFSTATITANLTLTAQWTINTYSVTFDTNGGTPATIASQTVDSGAMATKPTADPTRTGYTFNGWFAPSSTTVAFDFATATITADLMLTAKWIQQVTVTFDTNGGTPTIASQTVDSGAMATAPAVTTRDSFTFGGWFAPSATVAFDFATATITADLTLTAKWTQATGNQFTVTFDTNGGTPTIASQTVAENGVATAPAVPTRDGFAFEGWYTEPALTNLFNFTPTITAALTLTAKWTQQFTVTFNSNQGSTVDPLTVNKDAMATAPAVPTRTGFTFDGWFAPSSTTVAFDFTTTAITADLTLMAQWTINTYSVTFDTNGGTPATIVAQTVNWGAMASKPTADPTRSGFTFGGWLAPSSTTVAFDFAATAITADLTLTAKWTATPQFTVRFDTDGGNTVAPLTVDKDTQVAKPSDPVLTDATFGGWYTEPALTNLFDFTPTITADMTLYAKWTITYNIIENPTVAALVGVWQNFADKGINNSDFIIYDGSNKKGDANKITSIEVTNVPQPPQTWYIIGKFNRADGTRYNDYLLANKVSLVLENGQLKVTLEEQEHAGHESTTSNKINYSYDEITQITGTTPVGKVLDWSTIVTTGVVVATPQFTVTFNVNGGSDVAAITVDSGAMATAPADPTRSGYTFDGWFAPSSTTVAFDFTATAITADLTLTAQWTAVVATGLVTIPDAIFRAYLKDKFPNAFNTQEEMDINHVDITGYNETINVNNKGITDLTGIEYFKNLTILNCSNNSLTSLDVSKNTALTGLYCNASSFPSLDVSKNTLLTNLTCYQNHLKELDISKNTLLTELDCSDNSLERLDVSKHTLLTSLICYNNSLPSLDVSKNTLLTELFCNQNSLKELDISKNTLLTNLNCSGNQLTSLGVSKNTLLTNLSCSRNQLPSLDVSKNTLLTTLYCNNNSLERLDLRGIKEFTFLQIDAGVVGKNLLETLLVHTALQAHAEIKEAKTNRGAGVVIATYNDNNALVCANYDPNSDQCLGSLTELTLTFDGKDYAVLFDGDKKATLTISYQMTAPTSITVKGITTVPNTTASVMAGGSLPLNNGEATITVQGGVSTETYVVTVITASMSAANIDRFIFRATDNSALTADITAKITGLGIEFATPVGVDISALIPTIVHTGVSIAPASGVVQDFGKSIKYTVTAQNGTSQEYTISFSGRVTIPDINFRPYLKDKFPNAFNDQDEMEIAHADITGFNGEIDVSSKIIGDLAGIEYFTSLTSLDCSNNSLTSLDVRKNTALISLICSSNSLERLDVSKNTLLTTLYFSTNSLERLDVSKNTLLIDLDCSSNSLTSLDVTKNTLLTTLSCQNNSLTSLDIHVQNTWTSLSIYYEISGFVFPNPQLAEIKVHESEKCNTAIKEIFNANKDNLDMKIITYPTGSDIGTTLDEAAYTAACP